MLSIGKALKNSSWSENNYHPTKQNAKIFRQLMVGVFPPQVVILEFISTIKIEARSPNPE